MRKTRSVAVAPLTLDLGEVDRAALSIVGGKAANLGEMARAGLPVPGGFCVTTAAYEAVAGQTDLDGTLTALAGTPPEDAARLAELAGAARSALLEASVPDDLTHQISTAYGNLGDDVPVAVRSSATAEDLPQASFAGQQDTYLNVVGAGPILDAVKRCWASLWTERAVSYRAANGVDPRAVRLAAVVQRMVLPEVSGVMFTANPLTGRRRQAVIDASAGLGEAVVSGAVTPDHFVVDAASGEILDRTLGDKRVAIVPDECGGTRRVERSGGENAVSLLDHQVRALAGLGSRVEAHYGAPQDTEWAIDEGGKIWLLQARPITTLFPLPAGAPTPDQDLRVYFSASVAQGVYGPLTPMGRQAFRLLTSSISTLLGYPPPDPYAGPRPYAEAAGRLFVDVTPALRSTFGRGLLDLATRHMEARTAPILRRLAEDPRLSPTTSSPWPVIRAVLPTLLRLGIPQRAVLAFLRPENARRRAALVVEKFRAAGDTPPGAGAAEKLDGAERLLRDGPPSLIPGVPPAFIAGLAANALAGRLLGDLATDDERRVALRALPHNPTTEMDLALWGLAQRVRADPEAARITSETPPQELAQRYLDGSLPGALQDGLARFLSGYGHRAVAEIDLGLPRWSEDPSHVLGAISNYLRLEDPARAPDAQFRRSAREAEEMVGELTRRAGRKGRLRGRLVAFSLGRARALLGLREMPKFCIILLFARARASLLSVGKELAETGRLEDAADVFFLSLPEAWAAVAGEDLRPLVRERRADHEREARRRHVPRVLLSDGTEPGAEAHGEDPEGDLRGTPASGGVAKARARVILEAGGASLEPGEVLVAPSTDPGWTPLFLTAGGLVMEMGGPMSHGAIVAREYGIPAVVGVPDATRLIATGQEITVDGSSGTITLGGAATVRASASPRTPRT
jgi:pyruvate,water dikinase